MYDLFIVGAGASGTLASIIGSNQGLKCAIAEKQEDIARKILATGNGRCNITNRHIQTHNFHSNNKDFIQDTIGSFDFDQIIQFFENLGIKIKSNSNNRCYPLSNSATTIKEVLRYHIEKRKIDLFLNTKIVKIVKKDGLFKINSHEKVFYSKNLLISSGGKAAPHLGADDSGCMLASKFGHKIIKQLPSLTALNLQSHDIKRLKGIKTEAKISLFINNIKVDSRVGDLLFTDYGISGSVTLDISRKAVISLDQKQKTAIQLDLIPSLTNKQIENFLSSSKAKIYISLIGLIHKKIAINILKLLNIDKDNYWYNLTNFQKVNIVRLIKKWDFVVTGFRDFRYAEATIGGIDTKEIDSKTLMSKLVKNLYFSGEVLDIDGDCGGYNLAWAWASAMITLKSIGNKS